VSRLDSEIAEQPEVLERALTEGADAIAAAARDVRRSRPKYAVLAARGSSDNAGRYFQHLLGRVCGLPVLLATPSLHTLYGAGLHYEDALVVGVSQSGASPDVVSVLRAAGGAGALTIAITNEAGSPLAAEARHVVELRAGDERSVAATKTYTSSLGILAALAAAIPGSATLERELRAMPDALERQLERDATAVPAVTDELGDTPRLAVLGRGANYGTAFEAALKLKELAGIAAEPASPADFLHGPIAIVDTGVPVLAFALQGPALGPVRDVLVAVHARGGRALVIGDGPHAGVDGGPALAVEAVPEWLTPLVAVLPAQRLAAELAARRGGDVDRPFGLAKVTRTT
jgi:glucosamine--fructose-6-phosphate aminotransferase (isomerizing)